MWETLKKQWPAKVAIGYFVLLTILWIILQFMGLPKESELNQLWAAVYGFVILLGGIWGVIIAKKWGGFQSLMGKSILLFSLGLLSQEVGQLLYSYFIYFLQQPIPYPSVGDYFFWSTVPLYIGAVFFLAEASGVHISLRTVSGKLKAVIIPVTVLIFCYFVFLQGYEFDWSNPVKILIDLLVPTGEAIYISLALLTYFLTRGILGGIMKSKVFFILIALLAEYIADWTFLYQASRETWYAGGINDLMYFTAYFLMTLAILNVGTALSKLKDQK